MSFCSSTARAPLAILDRAFTLRLPHHQLEIIFDITKGGPKDLRPLFRHAAFGIAHAVELRNVVSGTIAEDHLQQMMECFGQRPYRRLFFCGVAPEQRVGVDQFRASAKAIVDYDE